MFFKWCNFRSTEILFNLLFSPLPSPTLASNYPSLSSEKKSGTEIFRPRCYDCCSVGCRWIRYVDSTTNCSRLYHDAKMPSEYLPSWYRNTGSSLGASFAVIWQRYLHVCWSFYSCLNVFAMWNERWAYWVHFDLKKRYSWGEIKGRKFMEMWPYYDEVLKRVLISILGNVIHGRS